jgi:membrane protease YdiL (CAAX protease family)
MIIQPLFQDTPPYLKLIFFILIIIASFIFVNVLGILIAIPIFGRSFLDGIAVVGSITDPELLPKLEYLQIVNQFALFIVPVILFALFSGTTIKNYLKLSFRMPLIFLFLAMAIILLGLPIINWIGEVNASMKLPQSFSGIEQWMRNSETQAADLTKAFLGTVSIQGFLINLLMIAILPAIGEEFFFRGILQRLFSEWFKNIHVAIFVTAFIFSTIHFQFFGFFPRFLLGLFLGYLFYWSGNLWIPIIIHFINNGLVVVISYIAALGYANIDYETFGSTNNALILLLTTLLISVFIFTLFRLRQKV